MFFSLFFKKIGMPSYLGRPTFISKFNQISIGRKVRVFPGARFETIGNGIIVIEDDVSIGPNVNITSANKVIISSGCTISANVFITDMDHNLDALESSVMSRMNDISEGTFIGENSFIGVGSVILAGTHLGKSSVVGANSVVRGEFSSKSLIAGAPATLKRSL